MPTAVADRRTKRPRIRRQRYSGRSVAVRLPVAPRALLVAAAIPLLFLHSEFQPSISVHVGGTSVDAYLTDFAVLAGNPAQVVGDTREKDEAWLAEHPELRAHYDAWARR